MPSYYYQLLTITIMPSPGTCIPECTVQQTVVQWRDRTVRGDSLRLSCAYLFSKFDWEGAMEG